MRRPPIAITISLATAVSRLASADEPPPVPPPEAPAPAPASGAPSSDEPVPVEPSDEAPATRPRPSPLADQPAVRHQGIATSGTFAGSARSNASDWVLMDHGYELGADLDYLTSEGGLSGARIDFTDVVLLGLHGRVALRGLVEVYGELDLLPKQPSFTAERVWQGATVGARIGATGWLAGEARLAGGTLLDRAGLWGSGALGATARKVVDPTLAFQGTLGGNYLRVDFDGDGGALWLAEVESRGDIQLRAPNGIAGVWVGVGFAFPIAHDGGYPAMGRFAPQTRGDLHVGGVYAVVPSWDVYVEYSILDRGDLVDPQTTLPVLAGGFDQRQLMLGVTRRFDVDEDDEAARLAW